MSVPISNTETLSTKVDPELWSAFQQRAKQDRFTNTASCLRKLISDYVYGSSVEDSVDRLYELNKRVFALMAEERLGTPELLAVVRDLEG